MLDVPAGYKRTEAGVIPEDWGVSTVAAEFSVQLGKMLDAAKNTGVSKPYIGNRSVQWGRIDLADIDTVPMTSADLRRFRLRSGDLLVCEGGEIGRAAIWEEPIRECYFQKALHRLRPIRSYDSYLMMSFLQLWASTGYLTNYVTQTSIAHLPKDKLETVPLPVPTAAEQRAIAAVLSDVDELIGSLEALIAKKRAIKQAAMQELLTGRTRLPGFGGEWEIVTLGQIGEITGAGVNKKRAPYEQTVRLLNYLSVYGERFILSRHLTQTVTAPERQLRKCAIRAGDVFFTPTSETPSDIGNAAVALDDISDGVYSYHVVRLRFHVNWDPRFPAYVFDTASFRNQTSRMAEGSGTRYVITLPRFRSLTVCVPMDLPEQHAIATTLSDMDAEIAALEHRLDKTRAIKQGMMQQLLAGSIRLPISDDDTEDDDAHDA